MSTETLLRAKRQHQALFDWLIENGFLMHWRQGVVRVRPGYGNGDGNGDGNGNGYGDGNGDGNGYGDRYGYGYGNGDGNGYGTFSDDHYEKTKKS